MGNYAGVDWAPDKHDVLVADERGEELLAATFAHDEKGLRSLCRQLVRVKGRVGRDRATGRAVGRAVARRGAAGARAVSQPGRGRARGFGSRAVSPIGDAFVLCELARTDNHRFRLLEPDSDETKALRAVTRAREDLVQTRVALCNQLRAGAGAFWPGPIGCSRSSKARSRSRSWRSIPARVISQGSVKPAWRRFCAASTKAAGRRRLSCSASSAALRRAVSARRSGPPGEHSCW